MTDRRQVLQLAAASAVGLTVLPGCSRETPTPSVPPTPDAQQSDEAALIALYDAALGLAPPAQTAVLQQIRDEHVAHLAALGWEGAPPTSSPPAVSFTVAGLARAERRAMRQRTQAARASQDAQMAQVLALIAASEAQHAVILEQT